MVRTVESRAMAPSQWNMVCQNSQKTDVLSNEYVNQNSDQEKLITALGSSILSSHKKLDSVKIIVDPNLEEPTKLTINASWPCCGSSILKRSMLKLSIHPLTLLSSNLTLERMVPEQQLFYIRLLENSYKSPDQLATGHDDMKKLNYKYQFVLPIKELKESINKQIIDVIRQERIQGVNRLQTKATIVGALLTMGIGNRVGQDILAEPSWHTWVFFSAFILSIPLWAALAHQSLCNWTSRLKERINLEASKKLMTPLPQIKTKINLGMPSPAQAQTINYS